MNRPKMFYNSNGYGANSVEAALREIKPGDIWEYNNGDFLILKNHGSFSTGLRIVDYNAPGFIQVGECDSAPCANLRYTDPRKVCYANHTYLGKLITTVSRVELNIAVAAVEQALSMDLGPEDILAEADKFVQEQDRKREPVDGDTEGEDEGLAIFQRVNRETALDEADRKIHMLLGQLDLLKDMYDRLLGKIADRV